MYFGGKDKKKCVLGFGGLCLADMPSVGKDQQPCHANAGMCDGGHLWLRHYFLIERKPFRRQQVFLSGMAWLVGIKQMDETFGNGGIQMVF